MILVNHSKWARLNYQNACEAELIPVHSWEQKKEQNSGQWQCELFPLKVHLRLCGTCSVYMYKGCLGGGSKWVMFWLSQ